MHTDCLLQKDFWGTEHQATKNVLDVAMETIAKHFVLLSAICIEKLFQNKLHMNSDAVLCAERLLGD